jgi:hypothetical protein
MCSFTFPAAIHSFLDTNIPLYVFFWVFPRLQIALTPGKYPKEYIKYSKHGESLKSRNIPFFTTT